VIRIRAAIGRCPTRVVPERPNARAPNVAAGIAARAVAPDDHPFPHRDGAPERPCPTVRIAVVRSASSVPVRRLPSMFRLRLAPLCAAVFLLAACGGSGDDDASPVGPPPPPPGPDTTAAGVPTLSRTVLFNDVASPWDIAFDADGTMFYTEKCRGLWVARPDGSRAHLFGASGAATVADDFFCQGQSGMHGVALAPDFATSRALYVFMPSMRRTNPRTNRVLRLELDAGFTRIVSRTDIVDDIAFKDAPSPNGGAGAHSGGRLRFGPDGHLYVTTGDNHDGALPQSPTRIGGKVLRLREDGGPAPGNGAPAGFDPRIFTYGHRNVQGIDFRPGTGQPFVAEHGPNHTDEVTPLVAGGNAGWDPRNRPALTCPDGYCGYAGSPASMPMTDFDRFPNAMRPSWSNDGASQGMGPAAFLRGAQWGAWDGALAVGIMGGRRLVVLTLDGAGTATTVAVAPLPAERYRALTLGPDGALYVAIDGGEIWRVAPAAP
jgi:glucose/arabinose dehydrogenase